MGKVGFWLKGSKGKLAGATVEAGSDVPSGGGGSTTPDTPSGGGSSTPSTGIQSVSINGTNLIAGTLGSANVGDNLVIRFNGAGNSVFVYEASDLQNAVASEDPDNGVATIALTAASGFAEGTEYRIYVGDDYANYKFSIEAESDTPGED